jgi:acetyl-CoA C-acetyltransferase
MSDVIIYEALRTPLGAGKRGGALYEVKSIDLIASGLLALRQRLSLDTALVDQVYMGCMAPVDDRGYNVVRTGLLLAGWHARTGAMQISAPGLEAIAQAAAQIHAGWASLAVAGGLDSTARANLAEDGHPQWSDPYMVTNPDFIPSGIAADLLATLHGISREELDVYALGSHQRTARLAEGRYLAPIFDRNGMTILAEDEYGGITLDSEKLAIAPPAFAALGALGYDEIALRQFPHIERIAHVHTAAHVAPRADGAAFLLLGNKKQGTTAGLRPRARILSAATVGATPPMMPDSAIAAADIALQRAGKKAADIDLWECQERFAALAIYFQHHFDLDENRYNVNGGALTLGDPPGAAGATTLCALLDEMERRNAATGLVALSASNGMGTAMVIELIK